MVFLFVKEKEHFADDFIMSNAELMGMVYLSEGEK